MIALHQIGVMIILAVELGVLGDFAVERERGADGVFDGGFVDDRQAARHSEADRADVGIRGCTCIIGGAGAKHFAPREQLRVNL